MAAYYQAMPPAGYYDYSTSTSTSPSPDEYARYPPPARGSKRHVRTASYTPPRVSVWQSPSPYGGPPAYYNAVPRYSSPPVAAARYDYVSSPELPATLRSRPRRSSAAGSAFEVQCVDINGKTSRRTSLRLPSQRIYVDASDDAHDDYSAEPVYYNIAPRTMSPQSKSKKATTKKSSADRISSPLQNADYALVDTPVRSRARRASTSSRTHTSTPPAKVSSREPVPATATDAARQKIPAGYSLKNWDPSERPILLLGSVFDANSLGKWIYDWTVYHHGPGSPLAEVAGDLWLILIRFGSKMKRAEEACTRRSFEKYWDVIGEFRDDGNRLWRKLVNLLKVCEEFMWQAAKKNKAKGSKPQMGESSGVEFVKTIFGRDRELPETEELMHKIRTWNFEYDRECDSKIRPNRR